MPAIKDSLYCCVCPARSLGLTQLMMVSTTRMDDLSRKVSNSPGLLASQQHALSGACCGGLTIN